MERLIVNLGKAVPAKMGGRDYLVAPLTLIVPGVLSGSQGPIYYPEDEVERWPGLWNHVPLVVYHPVENGQHVSARDPIVLDKSGVGLVLRDTYAENRRSAEAWFDVENTKRVDRTLAPAYRILPRLISGKPIEISTGLDLDKEPAPEGAAYNGQGYSSIARNFRPDHLAILPDAKGACSNSDGCGVNVNQGGEEEAVDFKLNELFEVYLNCGGEGGTPGPCKDEGGEKPPKEKKGKKDRGDKPLSPKTDSELTGHGWQKDAGQTYTHPDVPGTTITVTGFENAGGGRQRVVAESKDATGKVSKLAGAELIGYHGMKTAQRGRQLLGKDASKTTGNSDFSFDDFLNEKMCWGKPCDRDDQKKFDKKVRKFHGMDKETYKKLDQLFPGMKDLFRETYSQTGAHYGGKKAGGLAGLLKNADEDIPNSGEEPMKKSDMVQYLTANCECWKGDEKTLNGFKEDKLKKLVDNAKVILVVNQIKNKKTSANANGDDEAVAGVPWTELATLLGVDLNPADDPIAFAAALKSKVDEISSKLSGAEPAPAEAEVVMGATEEEEPVAMAAGTQEVEKTTNKKGKGMTTPKKPQSTTEWLASAPPDVRSAVTNAMNLEKQAKAKLVQKLVGNIAKADQRQAMGAKLMVKSLGELQDLVSLIPEAQSTGVNNEIPNFAFAGGAGAGDGLANNSFGEKDDSDNILPTFSVNFEEMASPKLRRQKQSA